MSLAHHIDLDFLHEAFRRTRKDGATGVDGRTAEEYEERLEENLQSLLDRFKSGRYKAPPVLRCKPNGGDSLFSLQDRWRRIRGPIGALGRIVGGGMVGPFRSLAAPLP